MDNWILDSAGERVQQQAVFKKRKKKESWQKKKKKKKSKKIFPDETISFWETQNFSAFFKCTSINFTRAKHAHRRTHNRLLLFCAALWLSSSSRMDVGKNRGREEADGCVVTSTHKKGKRGKLHSFKLVRIWWWYLKKKLWKQHQRDFL